MGTNKNVHKRRIRDFMSVIRKYNISSFSDARNIRLALEELGPTYIKLGQLVANRSDIFPEELCEELSNLRDEVEPMTAEEVDQVIYDAYGKKKEEIFSFFDDEPHGSASVAQVHYARLMSGEEVAVKIQRMGAAEEMEEDIAFLRRLVKKFPYLKTNPYFDADEVLDELWNITENELSFAKEAENLERFYELNSDIAYVSCPKVYPEFTTRTAIVMEFIRGIKVTDREALEAKGYDMNEIGRKFARSFLKQIFVDGFFHADPHAGNIMIEGGRIVWYDMGMMGEFSRRDINGFISLIESIITGDLTKGFDAVCRMGVFRRGYDKEAFFRDISEYMSSLHKAGVEAIDPLVELPKLFQMARKHKMGFNPAHTTMSRGIMIADGTLTDYFPEVDFLAEITSFATEFLYSAYKDKKPDKSIEFLRLRAKTEKIARIPENLAKMVEAYSKGLAPIKMEMGVDEKTQAFITEIVRMTTDVLIIVALLISSSIIVLSHLQPLIMGIPALGFAGYSVAVVMIIINLVSRLKEKITG